MNADTSRLQQAIIERLQSVIDPETNVDVVRMRLVEDLSVDTQGVARYIFRPSSPLCPVAVFLVQQIKQAISEVPGVTAQQIEVTGYVAADELTTLINKEN
jgi:metal-sulfur cluster biosynthetic enzyme